MSDLADYAWLTGGQAAQWLAAASVDGDSDLSRINRLRKDLSPSRAHLIVEQIELRIRAKAKFGALAEKMFFTDMALQQATDRWIAQYKAEPAVVVEAGRRRRDGNPAAGCALASRPRSPC